jgi:signal-transduction protein with cAMP-binding, CBS, and nucleotidyltransferase domain
MTETEVSQVMTSPVMTVEADEPLSEVAWAMREKEIKSIAVIDESCAPVGILTSTDFVRLAADAADPGEATVGEYMTEAVETVGPTASVTEVVTHLLTATYNHLPVVDDGVVGIVSKTDLLEHFAREEPGVEPAAG